MPSKSSDVTIPSRTLKLQDLPYYKAVSPEGRPLCCYCGRPVPKYRRSWCSNSCVHEFSLRSHPSYAASFVKKRDKGICRNCGLDCLELWRLIRQALPLDTPSNEVLNQRQRKLLGLRWSERYRYSHYHYNKVPRFWQVDHIVPVSLGGGGCGLGNLQTQCLWCHQRKTALERAPDLEKVRSAQLRCQLQLEMVDQVIWRLRSL
jgi:5-methylcytosine-specific restriction enzyme A